MSWDYTPPGGGGGGGGGGGTYTPPQGGITMLADFRKMADGALAASNGDAPEDPSGFTDVSAFAGGTSGLIAVRSGALRIDPSLATGEADCHGLIIQSDPIHGSVNSSFYSDGARFAMAFGAANLPSGPIDNDGWQTYMGYLMTDGNGDGWQFEVKAGWAFDGTLGTRFALHPVEGYVTDLDAFLYDSGVFDNLNYTAGMFWMDHNTDGTWAVSWNGTQVESGSGFYDQNDTATQGILGGQRGMGEGTPDSGLWIPMLGYAVTQPNVPLYTFGAA